MGCFINYFAYESPVPTEEAQIMTLFLTSVGVRASFQYALGWQPKQAPGNYQAALSQLLDIDKKLN